LEITLIKKLFSGAIANILNLLLQLVLGLWVFRELYNYLGEYDFGIWAILFAVFAHVVLFEFGLGMVITRHSSKDLENINEADTNLIESCFKTFYLFSVVVILFSLIGVSLFSMLFTENGEFNHGDSIILVSMLIAGSFIANYLSGAYQAYLLGCMQHGFVNKIRLITNLSRSFLILMSIECNLSVVLLALIYILTSLFELVLRINKCNSLGLAFNPLKSQYKLLKIFDVVKDRGKKLIFLRVNDYARNSAPILVASSFLGASAIAPLRVSGRLMELFTEVMMSFNFVLTPYFSKISTTNDQGLNKKVVYSIIISTAFTSLIFANLVIHGEWFLGIWLGQFPPETYSILVWFAAAFSVSNMQVPLNSFLIAKEHYDEVSFLAIIELILTLTCLIAGVYLWGIMGAAYALLCSMLIVRLLIQPKVAANVLKMKLHTYYGALFLPALAIYVFIFIIQHLNNMLNITVIGSNATQIIIQIVALLSLSVVFWAFVVKKRQTKNLHYPTK